MPADPAGEQHRIGLERGQAGDRVDGHGLPLPAGQRTAPADKLDRLGGVREELPTQVRARVQAQDAGRASLGAAVSAGPFTSGNIDLVPGQARSSTAPPVVLRTRRGGRARRGAPGPGSSPRCWSGSYAQRGLDPAHSGLDRLAALAGAGPLRAGRPAPLRRRSGRRRDHPDLRRGRRRHPVVDRPGTARRRHPLARDLRPQPVGFQNSAVRVDLRF
jgi:hypothetical protein